MTSARQILIQAGSFMGLPFLLLAALLSAFSAAVEETRLEFQEVESTCIDLAHYDARTKRLTVRFVDRDAGRFYRYSKVPPDVWKRLVELNEPGGVGNYFINTVVQHPEKYPFEKILIRAFTTIPKKTAD